MAVRLLFFCVCIGLIAHVHSCAQCYTVVQGRWGSPVFGTHILWVAG